MSRGANAACGRRFANPVNGPEFLQAKQFKPHRALRHRATSSADRPAAPLPPLPQTCDSTGTTSASLSPVAKGGMPKGCGLPAVAGAQAPSMAR